MEKIIESILKTDNYIEKSYRKGEDILSPSDNNNCFYIVVSGSCTVIYQDINGGEALIHKHEEGGFFGESEIVSPDQIPFLVVANEDCRLAVFEGSWFINKIRTDPDFSLFIIKSMSDGRVASTFKRTNLRYHKVRDRYLSAVKKAYDNNILYNITKKELAEQIDTPTRSLNRAILRCVDMVIYKDKHFIVVDEERLKLEVEDSI